MIIQYQDPNIYGLLKGDLLYSVQRNRTLTLDRKELRYDPHQWLLWFMETDHYFPVNGKDTDILSGHILIRKVDIDL